MEPIQFISDNFIEEECNFKELLERLQSGFSTLEINVPMRHHHDYSNPEEGRDSTLLLMPAFQKGKDLGVKIVTVSPNNGKYDLPSIQGAYIYLDGRKGNIKAILDAKSLTSKRTAATSALASNFLSRKDASSMLMIGTGALAINLIQAHASVRSITEVYVWGRTIEKAQLVCDAFKNSALICKPVSTVEEVISEVDIISAATLSPVPLVFGRWLKAGQHLDLVGAYKKDMREADDEAVLKSSLFLDTYQGGLKESGDILIPLTSGIITKETIKADLFELCSRKKFGRTSDTEITFFKSVGHALEDLVAAGYFYEKYNLKTKKNV
jgi:ornithine cyclodeaminase/alanine dehydrogenase-like protein (mu-crystallin family)